MEATKTVNARPPKMTIHEIYMLLNEPDLTLEKLDEIDQQLTEQYLGFYFTADVEKQLQQVCDAENRNPEINRHLLELTTGRDINSIYAMPKECKLGDERRGRFHRELQRQFYDSRIS